MIRVDEPEDAHRRIPVQLAEVCRNVGTDHLDQVAPPLEHSADRVPDGAPAVSADHELCPNLVVPVCSAVEDCRRRTLFVLDKSDELMTESEMGRVLRLRVTPQDRFQSHLRQVGQPVGAGERVCGRVGTSPPRRALCGSHAREAQSAQ